jgi:hypothetical protein
LKFDVIKYSVLLCQRVNRQTTKSSQLSRSPLAIRNVEDPLEATILYRKMLS